ncbi:MAG TPA: terminase small subunit [Candidatus Sumerlaeota bacterium]|nr:terminase small subunit [Candidatus Sumerlaeota bacterium]HPL75670.1 terminase small subunit [Candidatus Sumerlaeota bacterium]
MSSKNGQLTLRQKRFINAYLANGGNATQAAIKAGYSKKTASVIGQQNLNKLYIADAIKERIGRDPLIADADECQRYLSETMRKKSVERKDRTAACHILLRCKGAIVNRIETKVEQTTKPGAVDMARMLDEELKRRAAGIFPKAAGWDAGAGSSPGDETSSAPRVGCATSDAEPAIDFRARIVCEANTANVRDAKSSNSDTGITPVKTSAPPIAPVIGHEALMEL